MSRITPFGRESVWDKEKSTGTGVKSPGFQAERPPFRNSLSAETVREPGASWSFTEHNCAKYCCHGRGLPKCYLGRKAVCPDCSLSPLFPYSTPISTSSEASDKSLFCPKNFAVVCL